jgi:hypothetical protein
MAACAPSADCNSGELSQPGPRWRPAYQAPTATWASPLSLDLDGGLSAKLRLRALLSLGLDGGLRAKLWLQLGRALLSLDLDGVCVPSSDCNLVAPSLAWTLMAACVLSSDCNLGEPKIRLQACILFIGPVIEVLVPLAAGSRPPCA